MEWFLGIGLEELCLGDDGDVKEGVEELLNAEML